MKARRFLALSAGSLVLAASAALGSAAWADDPTPAPSATSVDAVSCDATPVADDGSWSQKCSDGSSYVYNADGSSVQTYANGCVISTDAAGTSTREGDCPVDMPIGGGGCWQQTDDTGAPVVDADGNPVTVCADGVACQADSPDVACPLMYASGLGSGRDNCPQCRAYKGAPAPASALNSDKLVADVAKLDSAGTAADQAAAIESAGANQPAVAMPAAGTTKGAGPVAPIAATVLGGGMVAAGVSIWRGRMKVGA